MVAYIEQWNKHIRWIAGGDVALLAFIKNGRCEDYLECLEEKINNIVHSREMSRNSG